MAVELATAYVSLVPSFRGGVADIQREARKMGQAASKSMSDEMTKSTKVGGFAKVGKAISGVFGGSLLGSFVGSGGLGQAIGSVASVMGDFVKQAQESAVVGKQTAAVLKSTGGVAKVSAKQVSDLATALSLKSGVDDEVIQSGENVLLTFTKVANQAGKGNDVFNQATSVALDMSRALGTDLQGSVIQVGKALNDPVKGITALQRVGVSFTASQKEQIKALVATGDTLGAQKLILRELNTEFGGAAAASATSSQKLSVAWGNFQETVGNVLLPILDKLSVWLAVQLPKAAVFAQQTAVKLSAWWAKYGDDITRVMQIVSKVLVDAFKIFSIQIRVGVKVLQIEWRAISWLVTFLNNWVVQPIRAAWNALSSWLTPKIRAIVAAVKVEWAVISAIVSWFQAHVVTPLSTAVGVLRNTIVGAIRLAVAGAKGAWSGLAAIYKFFVDNVQHPIESAVNTLRSSIRTAFELAVSAVKSAWDKLSAVVKVPINLVIGFYNAGIRGVWNTVISKIGLGTLPKVTPLATGGQVPGSGDRDTVPAMLTPGEFVVTKKAAKAWGPALLELLNKGPSGTADPGMFGYAGGGPVKSVQETQAWIRQQVGKPYSFAAVGPGAYDCSGFTSALINFVLGLYPYSRRHTSGNVGQDRALQPGLGDPSRGLAIGARPPYVFSRSGNFVGHTTSTTAGMNAEATPPAVRAGGGSRGASSLPQHYNLPGFGGLTADEKGIVDQLKSLLSLHLPDLGGPPMGDLLTKLFQNFPRMVFDFLVHKMPKIIFEGVVDAVKGIINIANPFNLISHIPGLAGGGTVRGLGPIVVGERGPEVLWSSHGQYVESAEHVAGRGGVTLNVSGSILGEADFRRFIRDELHAIDFRRNANPRRRVA